MKNRNLVLKKAYRWMLFASIGVLLASAQYSNSISSKKYRSMITKEIELDSFENCPDKIKSVQIEMVDFYVRSFSRVDCESFEPSFRGKIKDITLLKNEIDTFSVLFNTLKQSDSKKEIDVRARIFVTKKRNVVDTLCVGFAGISVNGVFYEENRQLIDFLIALNER